MSLMEYVITLIVAGFSAVMGFLVALIVIDGWFSPNVAFLVALTAALVVFGVAWRYTAGFYKRNRR